MSTYTVNLITDENSSNKKLTEATKVLAACAKKFGFELKVTSDAQEELNCDAFLFSEMDNYVQSKFTKMNIHTCVNYIQVYDSLSDKSTLKPHIINGTNIAICKAEKFGSTKDFGHTIKHAFSVAQRRQKNICIADTEIATKWSEVIEEMGIKYPNTAITVMSNDEISEQIMINPRQFDVILADSDFGTILIKLTNLISSSSGLLPSQFFNKSNHLFGTNEAPNNSDNPVATILSVSLLLEHLGEKEAAKQIKNAVTWTIEKRFTTDDINTINPVACESVGHKIVEYIEKDGQMITEKKAIKKEEFLYR